MLRLIVAAFVALAGPALAQDDDLFVFGGDAFGSGATVVVDREGLREVFGMGERVEIATPITGSAHLAGRRVTTDAKVGGDLVAFGADVTVAAPVAGSVTAAGYDLDVGAAVGGNLRAAGRTVRIAGQIAGSALLSAGTLVLDAPIGGDVAIDASSLTFGPDAAVAGRLMLYGPDAARLAVPEAVAPPERIERHPEASGAASGSEPGPLGTAAAGETGWMALATGFVVGALVLAVLVFLMTLVAPRSVEGLAARLSDEPVRTVWIGFLTLSALLGASVVALLTIVGVLAVPVILLATAGLCLLGYLVAVYVVGRAVWARLDLLPPDTVGERAIAALIGAGVVSLVGLVPFVGWPLLLVLTLAGLGALAIATVRPEFGR